MLRLHLALEALEGRLEQPLLPLAFPRLLEVRAGRGEAVHRRRVARRLAVAVDALGLGEPLAKLVRDAPARHLEQPRLEAAGRALVFRDVARDGEDRLLHHILRLGILQTRAACDRVDEPPVRIEKLLPPRAIVPVGQPLDQAVAGRIGEFGHRRFGPRKARKDTKKAAGGSETGRRDHGPRGPTHAERFALPSKAGRQILLCTRSPNDAPSFESDPWRYASCSRAWRSSVSARRRERWAQTSRSLPRSGRRPPLRPLKSTASRLARSSAPPRSCAKSVLNFFRSCNGMRTGSFSGRSPT